MSELTKNQTVLYQIAPTYFVEEGYYYSSRGTKHIRLPNAYGLGAFQGLDGELVVFNGTVYHGDKNCKLTVVENNKLLATATVVQFSDTATQELTFSEVNYKFFLDHLQKSIVAYNKPVAFKINGICSAIEVRSLLKQSNGFLDISRQPTVQFKDIAGDLVGFYFPHYLKNINTTEFHFHFIDSDKEIGGHVNHFDIKRAEVFLYVCDRIIVDFSDYQL